MQSEQSEQSEHRWRRFVLATLHRTAAMIMASIHAGGHVATDRSQSAQIAMAGQTVKRRTFIKEIGGIGRKNKADLLNICQQYGIQVEEKDKVEDIRNKIYNHQPNDGKDPEDGSGPRRGRDPNLPGLSRLRKDQLQVLAAERGITARKDMGKEELKALLYNSKPRLLQPEFTPLTRRWTTGTSSSSTSAPVTKATSKARPKAKSTSQPVERSPENYDLEKADAEWERAFAEAQRQEEMEAENEIAEAIRARTRAQVSMMTQFEREQMLKALEDEI